MSGRNIQRVQAYHFAPMNERVGLLDEPWDLLKSLCRRETRKIIREPGVLGFGRKLNIGVEDVIEYAEI